MTEPSHTTRDLYFAAFLQVNGAKLQNAFANGARCYFVFELGQENLAQLKTAWYGGHGEVSAMDYADTLKSLKALALSTI